MSKRAKTSLTQTSLLQCVDMKKAREEKEANKSKNETQIPVDKEEQKDFKPKTKTRKV